MRQRSGLFKTDRDLFIVGVISCAVVLLTAINVSSMFLTKMVGSRLSYKVAVSTTYRMNVLLVLVAV